MRTLDIVTSESLEVDPSPAQSSFQMTEALSYILTATLWKDSELYPFKQQPGPWLSETVWDNKYLLKAATVWGNVLHNDKYLMKAQFLCQQQGEADKKVMPELSNECSKFYHFSDYFFLLEWLTNGGM